MKKLLSLVLSVSMILTMMLGTVAFGETTKNVPEKGKIIVRDLEADATLKAYMIIKPTFDEDNLYTGVEFVPAVDNWLSQAGNPYSEYKNNILNNISKLGGKSETIQNQFYSALALAIKEGKVTPISEESWTAGETGAERTFDNVPIGQYLLFATSTNKVYNATTFTILPTLNDNKDGYVVKCDDKNMKNTSVYIKKKIIDKDATGKEVEKTKIAKGLGESVDYRIESAIPKYKDGVDRTKIVYKIGDIIKGQDIDLTSIKVYKDAIDPLNILANGTTTYYTGTPGKDRFEFTFDYNTIESFDKIIITYTATVNTSAEVTSGNPNTATLTYSNNPYDFKDAKPLTSITYLYTFGVSVFKYEKVDGEEVGLKDAVFALEKKNGTEYVPFDNKEYTTGDDGYVSISQLGAGDYQLVELVAPVGYNKIEGTLKFTVIANTDSSGNPTGTATKQWVDASGKTQSECYDIGFVPMNVANYKTLMPSTGGTGTLIFTVTGLILMAGAIIYLIIRKRMASLAK